MRQTKTVAFAAFRLLEISRGELNARLMTLAFRARRGWGEKPKKNWMPAFQAV
jgi:hypothetical protein